MPRKLFEVTNLAKQYGEKEVIKNISFSINEGDIYGFLGKNGAGKTTTIRLMLGLISADSGKIIFNGYDLKKDFSKAIGKLGAMVETPKFYNYLSAYQNLNIIANLYNDIDKNKIFELLNLVQLQGFSNTKVKEFSTGMKQRLGIARALINDPKFVILDEPTNGLDPQGMKKIRNLIVNLSKSKNITFFISSHLLNEIEQMCNRMAILQDGMIIKKGYMREIYNKEQEKIEIITEDVKKSLGIIKGIEFIKCFTKKIIYVFMGILFLCILFSSIMGSIGFISMDVNGIEYTLQNLSFFAEILFPIFSIIFIADFVTEELTNQTFELSLIHPVSRKKFLDAKMISISLFLFILMIYTIIISCSFGLLFFGWNGNFNINGIRMNWFQGLLWISVSYMITLIILMSFNTGIFVIALVSSSSGVTVGLSMGIFLMLSVIKELITFLKPFIINTYFRLYLNILNGINIKNLVLDLIVVFIYGITGYIISLWIMKKRDFN